MPNVITDADVEEISLVDDGMNQHATVLLAKRANKEEGDTMTLEDVLSALSDEQKAVLSALSDEQKAAMMAALEAAAKQKEGDNEDTEKQEDEKEPETEKSADGGEGSGGDTDEIAKRDREIAELRSDLRKLKERDDNRVYLEKAKALPALKGKTEEKRDLLKACASVLPDKVFGNLMSMLKSANELIQKGGLGEQGNSGNAPGGTDDRESARLELNDIAKQISKDSGGKVSPEKALLQAVRENPGLAKRLKGEG